MIRLRVPTLVCCGMGLSRSPAVAAAALAIVRREPPDEVLRMLADRHPVDVSPGFWSEVRAVRPIAVGFEASRRAVGPEPNEASFDAHSTAVSPSAHHDHGGASVARIIGFGRGGRPDRGRASRDRRGGRGQAPARRDGRPRLVRVHARRQVRHLPEGRSRPASAGSSGRPTSPAAPPRVIARPPGSGDTDANVSKEEALRRERQRLRDTGITQVVRAKKADVAIIPLGGDLYVLKGSDGPLERLTETPSPEIDPQLERRRHEGRLRPRQRAVRARPGHRRRRRSSAKGPTEGLTHGLAEFMAQEEMGRFTGFWWSPDGKWIAYQETDERHIPLYSIVHQGGDYSVETHRYPFPGAANAKVRLGVVAARGRRRHGWLDFAEPRRRRLSRPGRLGRLVETCWSRSSRAISGR